MRRQHILLLLVALIAVLPLFVFGCSCGHDFDFHIQSWLEAMRQLLHGTFRPHWVFSAAYNAGEPRFVFYPPLSWVLGELLALVTPIAQLPAIYTFVVLALAGQTMYRFAREFVSEDAAMLGAALYTVNPYMLFTAYERSAFAELLAAAWMPLLLRALLKKRPTIAGIAVPLALLWLTNAPAAVIGSYTLAVVMTMRLVMAWRKGDHVQARQHLLVASGGTALGLGLTAFYLAPAAYERKFVQIAMAVIVNMRVQDNFLFGHTGDVDHDTVLRTASWIAVAVLGATAALLAVAFLRKNDSRREIFSERSVFGTTALSVAGIAFLLTPASRLLWDHVPELAFLQFPWRLLTVAAVAFGVAAAMAAASLRATFPVISLLMLTCAVASTAFGSHAFRQGCDASDYPAAIAQALQNHQGFPATDEYTPKQADNDALRADNPQFWLTTDPRASAAGTTPHPAGPPASATGEPGIAPVRTSTPQEFVFDAHKAGYLVMNLRAYPNWEVSLDDPNSLNRITPPSTHREDGLEALQLWAGGTYRAHVEWRRSLDERIGIAVSSVACLLLAALLWRSRSRRIKS